MVNAILKVLQVYVKEITPDSTFKEDLGADSLDMVQILRLVEADLNIKISDVDIESVITVNDALNVIKKAMN